MAIGMYFDGPGGSQAQYDAVHDEVTPNNQMPPGLVYHAAGPTETGFCVIEVWESQEAAQQFFEQKLGQALQKAGFPGQPKFFQVSNTMQA